MTKRTIKLALVGGGMFGRDVVFRCLADIERCGIGPYLAHARLPGRGGSAGDGR